MHSVPFEILNWIHDIFDFIFCICELDAAYHFSSISFQDMTTLDGLGWLFSVKVIQERVIGVM